MFFLSPFPFFFCPILCRLHLHTTFPFPHKYFLLGRGKWILSPLCLFSLGSFSSPAEAEGGERGKGWRLKLGFSDRRRRKGNTWEIYLPRFFTPMMTPEPNPPPPVKKNSIRRLSFPPITTYTAFTPYNDNGNFFFFFVSSCDLRPKEKNPRFVFPLDMVVVEVLFQNIDLISFGETGNWFSSTPPFDTFRREKIGKWRNSPVVEILEWQQKSWLFWAGLSHLGQRKREHKLEFEMWLALFTNQRFFA